MDYPIRPVCGNWTRFIHPLEKVVWRDSQKTIVDYVPQEGDTLTVTLQGAYKPYVMENVTIEGNVLKYENNGTLPCGVYDVVINVVLADGKRLRSHQDGIVKVVKTNKEASIPDYVEFGIDTYELDGAVFMYVPNGEGESGEDGVGIDSITTVESAEDGGNNVVTIHLTDGTQSSFNVKNGHKGSDGAQGPQGQQGPQGAQGEKGETGEQGPQGPAGQNGTNGINGTDGSDGKSAYEIAVESGFVGDETAWLASLKGEQGEQGPTGLTGPQGPQGPQGVSGLYPLVEDTTSTSINATIEPNKFYVWKVPLTGNSTITLGTEVSGVMNEYLMQFSIATGSTPQISFSSNNIQWAGIDTFQGGKTYQVSIVNGYAIGVEFDTITQSNS